MTVTFPLSFLYSQGGDTPPEHKPLTSGNVSQGGEVEGPPPRSLNNYRVSVTFSEPRGKSFHHSTLGGVSAGQRPFLPGGVLHPVRIVRKVELCTVK